MCNPYRNEIETLQQFQLRTQWKDEKLRGICVPDDQNRKIRPDGFFETLLGDTVLFSLTAAERKQFGMLRDELYKDYRDILCAPLPDHSLHITLHDLSTASLDGPEDIRHLMDTHKLQTDKLLRQFRMVYPRPIRLRPSRIVSMVARSVVLLLEPATDEDCMALTDMYRRLDSVVPLPEGIFISRICIRTASGTTAWTALITWLNMLSVPA